jgi:nitroreductase
LWAPSGHNRQPWHFLVIQDKEMLDRMSDFAVDRMRRSSLEWVRNLAGKDGYHLFHNAPTVIVVSGTHPDEPPLSALVDCSAAIQNMLVAAESLDIGTCWIGLARFFFEDEKQLPSLRIPEGYRPLYSVAMGYKADDYIPTPMPRKSGTVSWYRRGE